MKLSLAGLRGIAGWWLWKLQHFRKLRNIERIVPRILRAVPHEPHSHTQGMFFRAGELWESTGLYGLSSLRQINQFNGKVVRNLEIPKEYYAEDITFFDNNIVQLTWENEVALIYDTEDLNTVGHFSYKGEGWGLTTDTENFFMTNGSSWLTCRNEKFDIIRSVPIKALGRHIEGLNAMEYMKGRLLINVYGLDDILVVDPATGEVQASIACHEIAALQEPRMRGNVLNGIAYNPNTEEIYLTGKGWGRYYVIDAAQPI